MGNSPLSSAPLVGCKLYLTISSHPITQSVNWPIVLACVAAQLYNDLMIVYPSCGYDDQSRSELGPRVSGAINRLFSMLIALVTLEIITVIRSTDLHPPLCT